MRPVYCVVTIILALLSSLSAEGPQSAIATIRNVTSNELIVKEQSNENTDAQVNAFIAKNGVILELPESRSMGSFEARQEQEPGMTMCRYGNIVVYSDADCNTFLRPPQRHQAVAPPPMPVQDDKDESEQKPLRRKKGNKQKIKRNNKKKRKNLKQQNGVRRKAVKRKGNKKRRRNNLNQKQKQKRRKNQQKKNKRRNQRRGGNKKNLKRKRINYSEPRSFTEPIEYTILYDSR